MEGQEIEQGDDVGESISFMAHSPPPMNPQQQQKS